MKVVEARGLIGGDLNPTCRVSLGNDGKSTRVQKATSNPWFDEIFFYYLKKLPSEVWDTTLEFRVSWGGGEGEGLSLKKEGRREERGGWEEKIGERNGAR